LQEFEAAAVSTRSLKAASCVNRFGLQSSVPLHAELLELLELLLSWANRLEQRHNGHRGTQHQSLIRQPDFWNDRQR